MWRQGDVMFMKVGELPDSAARREHLVLAEGEMTGHAHRVEDPETAELFQEGDTLYLRITASKAKVVHEEHGTIELVKGLYKVWKQREYSPGSLNNNRLVVD